MVHIWTKLALDRQCFGNFSTEVGDTSLFCSDGNLKPFKDESSNSASLHFGENDLRISARSIPMTWERNYRSNRIISDTKGQWNFAAPADSPLGFGWHNIWLCRIENDSFKNEVGHYTSFGKDANGAYLPNLGAGLTLRKTVTGYELIETGGKTYTFDSTGKLLTLRDSAGNSATLQYDGDNLISITDVTARQIFRFTYNAEGHIATITDLANRIVTYDYDINGNLIQVKHGTDVTATYSYNANHGITTKTDATGSSYTILYYSKWEDKGVVQKITNPGGQSSSFIYDFASRIYYTTDYSGVTQRHVLTTSGMIQQSDEIGADGQATPRTKVEYLDNRTTRTTDALGNTTTEQKDDRGNIIKRTDADGNEWRYQYDANSRQTTATDPLGTITKYEYDQAGNRTKETQAAGTADESITTFTYNSYREQLTSSSNGATTTYSYDNGGNAISLTDPENNTISVSYDAVGNPISRTVPLERITTFETDFKGRITAAIDPLGIRTEYAYDGNGNKTKINRGDSIITMVYDSQNRMSSLTDPEGNTINYSYNPSSCASCGANVTNIEQITDPLGNTTNYSYDKAKRVTGITDPLSNITKFQRDAVGKITTRTDANNNSTGYQNDALKRIAKQTDANGNNITFSYDARGNLTQLTDQNGNSTIFAYDKNNRVTKETRPMGQTTDYTYWPNGTLKTTKDAKNQTTQYTYDAASRLTEITYADSTKDTFGYDANGNLTSYAKPGVQGTITYDELRRKTGETVNYGTFSKSFSYTYDAKGNKASYTSPENTTYTYGYNKNGQPTGITFSGKTITFDYQWIRQTKQMLPNGITTNFGYNSNSWLSAMETKQNSTTLGSQNYQFDNVGNITGKTGDISAAYGYDKIYQLTSAGQETFTFDKTGNRTMSGYSHNANNELTATTTATYVYDANGNTISKTEGTQVTTYGYDVRNRLVQVTLPDGTTASYTYDPFGRRIKKQTPTDTTYYLYANEGLIGEYTETGTTKKAYGWRPNGIWGTNPLFQVDNGNYYYYHNDHLGTPQRITDESGSTVWNATYSAFGKATVTVSTISSNLRLPGQYADEETGLHYNWFRYYDVGTGRYISVDPIGFWAGDVNLYRYVQNNPVSLIDPWGLSPASTAAGMASGALAGSRVKKQCQNIDPSGRRIASAAASGAVSGAVGGAVGGAAMAGVGAVPGGIAGAVVGFAGGGLRQTVVEAVGAGSSIENALNQLSNDLKNIFQNPFGPSTGTPYDND